MQGEIDLSFGNKNMKNKNKHINQISFNLEKKYYK